MFSGHFKALLACDQFFSRTISHLSSALLCHFCILIRYVNQMITMHWPDMCLGENWSHAGIGILADTEPMTKDSVLNIHYLVLQFRQNMYT